MITGYLLLTLSLADIKMSVGKLFAPDQFCSAILVKGNGSSELAITPAHCLSKAIKYQGMEGAEFFQTVQLHFTSKAGTVARKAKILHHNNSKDLALLKLFSPINKNEIPGIKINEPNKYDNLTEMAFGYVYGGASRLLSGCKTITNHKFSTTGSLRAENCNVEGGMSGGGYFAFDGKTYRFMGMLVSKGAPNAHVAYYVPSPYILKNTPLK